MEKKLKLELTRKEILKLLEVFHAMDSLVDNALECCDVSLSELSDLRDKSYTLSAMFNFRPTVGEDGNPNHWKDKVLPDDPDAWFYESNND